jgi:hypothetical protein
MHVVELLKDFALNGPYNDWHKAQFDWKASVTSQPNVYEQAKRHLERFFNATMDEVRLFEASTYVSTVLELTDVEDYDHFRQGVLRREVSGEIAYQKQRDHSGHTLYNYLLGWFFYAKSRVVQDEFKRAIDRRKITIDDQNYIFADLWAYVSLLHDIGYLFEGNLAPLSSKVQDDQVRLGADVAQEYFDHRFWTALDLAGVDDKNTALRLSKVSIPQLESRSMAGLAFSLRSLGNLDELRQELNDVKILQLLPPIANEDGLAQDAFELWRQNYEFYGAKSMLARIDYLEHSFLDLMRHGFANTGIRVLDHGVCSGLMLLLASTFYFRVAFGKHTKTEPSNERRKRAWKKLNKNSSQHGYQPEFWWQATIWASAATAVHNVAQSRPSVRIRKPHPGPLSINEDPLAYLGILVDILQEWDRNNVARTSPVTGDSPLQGIDVTADLKGDKLSLDFGPERNGKVAKELNWALKDWNLIVEIEK